MMAQKKKKKPARPNSAAVTVLWQLFFSTSETVHSQRPRRSTRTNTGDSTADASESIKTKTASTSDSATNAAADASVDTDASANTAADSTEADTDIVHSDSVVSYSNCTAIAAAAIDTMHRRRHRHQLARRLYLAGWRLS